MKTPTASSATSSQREQTFLLSQVPRSPRSNGCSTPRLENPSASVHPKRFSTPSLTPKFLCAGKLNPRMIVTGGENVYSGEVETVIYQHPAVREAAVFGVPDSQWGEIVMACVVLKTGRTLGVDELTAHCR